MIMGYERIKENATAGDERTTPLTLFIILLYLLFYYNSGEIVFVDFYFPKTLHARKMYFLFFGFQEKGYH